MAFSIISMQLQNITWLSFGIIQGQTDLDLFWLLAPPTPKGDLGQSLKKKLSCKELT